MKNLSLAEAGLRQKYQVQVLATQGKDGTDFNYATDPTAPLKEGDTLVVLGAAPRVMELREVLEKT